MYKSPEPVASKPPALSSLLRPDGVPIEYMRPRAHGGPIARAQTYLVGEHGPEVVKPEPPAPIKE